MVQMIMVHLMMVQMINISCIIEKDNKYYPEIYLDECLYVKDNTWRVKHLLSCPIKFPDEGIVFK